LEGNAPNSLGWVATLIVASRKKLSNEERLTELREIIAIRNGGHDFSAIFADRRVFFRWVLFLRTHPGDTTVCVAGSAAPAERPTTRGRRSQ